MNDHRVMIFAQPNINLHRISMAFEGSFYGTQRVLWFLNTRTPMSNYFHAPVLFNKKDLILKIWA
jgi:hypothetical protein